MGELHLTAWSLPAGRHLSILEPSTSSFPTSISSRHLTTSSHDLNDFPLSPISAEAGFYSSGAGRKPDQSRRGLAATQVPRPSTCHEHRSAGSLCTTPPEGPGPLLFHERRKPRYPFSHYPRSRSKTEPNKRRPTLLSYRSRKSPPPKKPRRTRPLFCGARRTSSSLRLCSTQPTPRTSASR